MQDQPLNAEVVDLPRGAAARKPPWWRDVVDNQWLMIGMLFFVPGHQHSLRINGEARIRTDQALRERFAVNGKPARAVVEVTARQVFFHCG